jgi:hypothetical protein
VRVQFKFNETVPPAERERLVGVVKSNGAKSVEPLFPGESDPGLASFYTIECPPEAGGDELISLLDSSDSVEFAEPEPIRKLVSGSRSVPMPARASRSRRGSGR